MAVESPPIIIKKIKKGGHGHHGGAWKVAFADFVTAMMAFFMLMWLMGSTTPAQKAAISEYMNDPMATGGSGGASKSAVLQGGDGILEGHGPSAFAQAAPNDATAVATQTTTSTASTSAVTTTNATTSVDAATAIAAQAEAAKLEDMRKELLNAVEQSDTLKAYKDQLLLDLTSEGLRIQIVDKENRAMFAQGSPVLENYMRDLLHEVAKVVTKVPNRISISGHTDQTPYASKNGYSNWELSSDRANAARRELLAGGLEEDKIGKVVGLASSVLFDKKDPFAPNNRRISIIVMKKAADTAANSSEAQPLAGPGVPIVPEFAGRMAEAATAEAAPQPTTQSPDTAPPAAPASESNAPIALPTSEMSAAPIAEPTTPTESAPAPSPEPLSPPKVKKIVKIAIAQ